MLEHAAIVTKGLADDERAGTDRVFRRGERKVKLHRPLAFAKLDEKFFQHAASALIAIINQAARYNAGFYANRDRSEHMFFKQRPQRRRFTGFPV